MKKIVVSLFVATAMFVAVSNVNAGGFGLSLNLFNRQPVRVERQVDRHDNRQNQRFERVEHVELRSPIRVYLQAPVRERIVVERVEQNNHHHNNVQEFKEVQRIVRDQYGRERIVVERIRVR